MDDSQQQFAETDLKMQKLINPGLETGRYTLKSVCLSDTQYQVSDW